MFKSRLRFFNQFTSAALGLFSLGYIFAQPSLAMNIETESNTDLLSISGFVEWDVDDIFDQTIHSDRYWEVDFSYDLSQTIIEFTHLVATEPGESPNNGPFSIIINAPDNNDYNGPLDIEFFPPGIQTTVLNGSIPPIGVRHPGGASDDADFYDLNIVNIGIDRLYLDFEGAHQSIASRPGVPVINVPEPITILGTACVLGIGVLLKKKQKYSLIAIKK